MKLPTDGIDAFVTIAKLGNFQRAADKMHITQTALTRRIQKLEEFLGLRLLDRTTRSTKLTSVGREFLPTAERILYDLNSWIDQLRHKALRFVGDVRLATLQSVAVTTLPTLLLDYQRDFPNNRITLMERSGATVTEIVIKGEADFGIHIQQCEHDDLEEDCILDSPFSVVCHYLHPMAKLENIAWQDIPVKELIILGGKSGNRHLIEAQLIKAGVGIKSHFVVESSPTALALCRERVGIAILPENGGKNIHPDLREIPIIDPIVKRRICLIKRKSETLSPAAQSLYNFIRDRYHNRSDKCR